MGAHVRILPQEKTEDGFAFVRDILNIVKNPKDFQDAHELARKEAQLTEEEVQKVNDARSLMTQAESLKEALRQREDALMAEKMALERAKEEFSDFMESERIKLQEERDRLNAISNAQIESAAMQMSEREKFEFDKASLKASHEQMMKRVKDSEDLIAAEKESMKEESKRLIEWGERLEKKAKKMMQAAAEE